MLKPTQTADVMRLLALIALATALGVSVAAEQHDHDQRSSNASSPQPFVVSTAKPFAQLMNEAMATMERGMHAAPMTGSPDHDFVTMMIPHHQGAIDMARALLLSTTDPELRNLAQGIITEQENEIRLMRRWLERHPEPRR